MADAPIPPLSAPRPYHPAPALVPKKQGSRLRTITALILREMQARYGNSPGGYVWAVLDPVGKLMIMSFLFSFVIRSPSLGNSFILFYATGLLPFALFSAISGATTQSLNYSRALLTYPVVMWLDAIFAAQQGADRPRRPDVGRRQPVLLHARLESQHGLHHVEPADRVHEPGVHPARGAEDEPAVLV